MRTALVTALWAASATLAAADDPPVLESLNAANVGLTFWIISGTVTDEDPDSCSISFGDDLAGHTTGVDANGNFQYVVHLPSGGLVSAIAYDSPAQPSNELVTDAF